MKADVLYKSSNIYTVTNGTVSGGVAVNGQKILAVGSMDALADCISEETKIVDFGDRLLMPGLIDAHTHMFPFLPKVDMSSACSIEECAELTGKFRQEHPDLDLIMGEGWYPANWDGTLPTAADIDAIVPDVPFYATDVDLHKCWVNSVLLKELGLTKDTIPEMTNGLPSQVEVDADGNPTGLLHDKMCLLVKMKWKVEDTEEMVSDMFGVWTRYGVTAINDMDMFTASESMVKFVTAFQKENRLPVRVFLSLSAAEADDKMIEEVKRGMDTDMLRLNALKVFLDGTGSGHTAYMLQPYADFDGRGTNYETAEQLLAYTRKAARHGLALHVHCCGDAAVRMVMENYQAAKADGIKLDPRFSMEHLDTTAPEDVESIGALGVSLNLTPDFLAPTVKWDRNPYLQVYDKNVQQELWTLRSFIRAGANVAFGTDYTCSSMNPMVQLYRATMRVANDGCPAGGYRPEEKLTIEEAIRCYTLNSAKSIGMADKLGSLEPGKYADMIVLDTDILTCSPEKLKAAVVDATILNGNVIYSRM